MGSLQKIVSYTFLPAPSLLMISAALDVPPSSQAFNKSVLVNKIAATSDPCCQEVDTSSPKLENSTA